jgi:hypothetical protein
MTEETCLGTVAVLRRYPVKSMLGEDLRAGEVTARFGAAPGGNFVDFAPLQVIRPGRVGLGDVARPA